MSKAANLQTNLYLSLAIANDVNANILLNLSDFSWAIQGNFSTIFFIILAIETPSHFDLMMVFDGERNGRLIFPPVCQTFLGLLLGLPKVNYSQFTNYQLIVSSYRKAIWSSSLWWGWQTDISSCVSDICVTMSLTASSPDIFFQQHMNICSEYFHTFEYSSAQKDSRYAR